MLMLQTLLLSFGHERPMNASIEPFLKYHIRYNAEYFSANIMKMGTLDFVTCPYTPRLVCEYLHCFN